MIDDTITPGSSRTVSLVGTDGTFVPSACASPKLKTEFTVLEKGGFAVNEIEAGTSLGESAVPEGGLRAWLVVAGV